MTTPSLPSPDDGEHAAAVRDLCAGQRFGTLATLARDPAGFPFASLVAYAIGANGAPIFLLSNLAEHTQNLLADARASLLVCAPAPAGKAVSSLALPRATLLGEVEAVGPDTVDAAQGAYLAAHPDAARYLELDFRFYRLRLHGARYVGGFGRMSWVPAAALLSPA